MFESWMQYINLGWIYYVFWTVYFATVITIIGVIISENRNPVKSLAWVTVLFLLPIVGIVLYLFFGRSIKNTRMISRRNRRRLKRKERAAPVRIRHLDLSTESRQQIYLARSLTGAHVYVGNEVEIFGDGASKFESLKRDLRAATSYIHMQYYIFEDDTIGCEIRDILIERARAGVAVRLIYDHVGSFKVRRSFFREMKEAGILAYPFFKVSFPPFGTRINWRNHRKIVVIDSRVGYIGGMNIADRYIDGGKFGCWRDTHLRVTGSVVSSLQYSFAVDWHFMGQPLIADDPAGPVTPAGPDVYMQHLTSGPTSQWSNIAYVFHKAISNAKRRVYIQTPYFLPTEGLLKALQTAALSHVDVRIMIPRRGDSAMLSYATASYISECLRAGIKIYMYEPGMLHAKTIVVDDEFSSVGSTNFDFRSFEHNFESNMFMYSREVNARLTAMFREDMKQSTRIRPEEWHRRPLIKKSIESILRLLSPIL